MREINYLVVHCTATVSTDNENDPEIGYSDVGCACVPPIKHTTTTNNNTILVRGALDTTSGIQARNLNSSNGESSLTYKLIYTK